MTSGFDLGNARGYVDIDPSGVVAGMDQARQAFAQGVQSMGDQMRSVGDSIANVGANLTVLTAPIAAFGAAGIRSASQFQDAMAEIQARTGLTTEEMERLRQKALDLGRDTVFSAGQGADAFLQLLTSGQSVEEAFLTIDAVMQGAAASGEQLGFVSDALTDILASFQLEASASGDVLEAMSDAAGSSSATFGDLVMGFQNVGALAAQFGLSVRDTSAILATFAERGIKGAEAGTQLKSMLGNMTRDTEDVQGMWRSLGISMFDAMGNARPLGEVMQELRVALEGMTDEERINTIKTLAGNYGQLGLMALTTGDSFEDMLALMDQAGSAADVAAARMGTFSGTIDFVRGSLETLSIQVMTPFMDDTLKPMLVTVGDVINQVTAWAVANPELAQTIISVAAAVTALGPALFAGGKALSAIGGLVSTFGAGLGFLLSPIGLVVAAVGALGVAWATDFMGMRDVLQPFVDGVSKGIESVWWVLSIFISDLQNFGLKEAILSIFGKGSTIEGQESTLEGALAGILGIERDRAIEIVESLWDVLQPFVDAISNSIGAVWHVLSTFVADIQNFGLREAFLGIFGQGSLGETMQSSLEGALVSLGVGRDQAIKIVQSLWNSLSRFANNLQKVFDRVSNALKPLFVELVTFFSGLFDRIDFGQLLQIGSTLLSLTNPIGIVMTTLRAFGVDFLSIFENIGGGITTFMQTINAGGGVFDGLRAVFGDTAFITTIEQGLNGLVTFVTDTVIPGLDKLRVWFVDEALPAVVAFIQTTVLPAVMGFFNFLGQVWAAVSPGLMALVNWFIQDALPLVIQFISDVAVPYVELLVGVLSDIWRAVAPYLLDLWNWFTVEGLPAITTFLSETVIPIIGDVIGILKDLWEDVSPFLFQLLDWFITSGLPLIKDFIEQVVMPVVSTLVGWLIDLWEAVQPGLTQLYDWFVTTALPGIIAFLNDTVTPLIQGFIDLLATIWNVVEPGLTALKEGFVSIIGWVVDNVVQPFIDLLEGIAGIVEDAVKGVSDIVGAAGDVIGGVQDFAKDPVGTVVNAGENLVEGVVGGVGKGIQDIGDFFGLAEGGFAQAGQAYMVGEQGPELFVPRTSGAVMPNGSFGGSTITLSPTIQQTFSGNLNDPQYIGDVAYEATWQAMLDLLSEIEAEDQQVYG